MKKTVKPAKNKNPFLTKKADELWKRLGEKGKPVSKQELLEKIKDIRTKSSK